MSYPEDTPAGALCGMEGHVWLGGGRCVRCAERLRCLCGAYVTEKGLESHNCPSIAMLGAGEQEGTHGN